MIDGKKVLALIPARSGSKGVPGKNIKQIAGKPLIAWTIGEAKHSRYIDEALVSTDDKGIAVVAKRYGGNIPFLRPKKLAGDKIAMIDVMIHLLDEMKRKGDSLPYYIVLLQPTSPLRTAKDIDHAIEQLVKNPKARAVVSITPVSENPFWMKTLTPDGFIKELMAGRDKPFRRQDLPPVFITNGALYVCRTKDLLKDRTFFCKPVLGYVMPWERSVDIDNMDDFHEAQRLLTAKRGQHV